MSHYGPGHGDSRSSHARDKLIANSKRSVWARSPSPPPKKTVQLKNTSKENKKVESQQYLAKTEKLSTKRKLREESSSSSSSTTSSDSSSDSSSESSNKSNKRKKKSKRHLSKSKESKMKEKKLKKISKVEQQSKDDIRQSYAGIENNEIEAIFNSFLLSFFRKIPQAYRRSNEKKLRDFD
jgi:hypothetical protein